MFRSAIFQLLCISSILLFAGCDALFSPKNLRPLDELTKGSSAEEYRATRGDTLMINVWGEPRVSGEVFVRDDGRFTLPLINDVPAAGRTLQDIADDVTLRLAEFIPSASVSVSIIQSAAVRYFLSGAFMKPGEYRSAENITFIQAIATGGGFAPFANEKNITLIRKTSAGDARYRLDYNRVVNGDQPNPVLKSGDVISVR